MKKIEIMLESIKQDLKGNGVDYQIINPSYVIFWILDDQMTAIVKPDEKIHLYKTSLTNLKRYSKEQAHLLKKETNNCIEELIEIYEAGLVAETLIN